MSSKSSLPSQWVQHDQKLSPYLWSHRIIGIADSVLGLLLVGVLIFTPAGREWEAWLEARFQSPLVIWLFFFGGVAAASKVLTLPTSVASHLVERRYGLSKQGLGSWFGDQLKMIGIAVILGSIILSVVWASLGWFPTYWWVFCCVFLILFSIVLAQLAPVLLLPLFYKFKPMENGALKERLLSLCTRFKIEVKEVYHMGLGEKTEKGNAAFMGLGRTKRIVIGDTLYEKFLPEEVEAVFAHELGHQVHNDLWKGIAIGAFSTFLAFALGQYFATQYVIPHWASELRSPFGFLLFFVTLSLVQMPLGVLQAFYSRTREWAADSFANVKTGLSAPLSDALERLTYQNYGRFRPNPLMEFLTHSHPAPWRRITKLRGTAN